METIAKDELVKLVEARGLPIVRQAAFLKIESGPKIMHIANPGSGRVNRVDLKGFDDLEHPALRRVERDEAEKRHLGRVSRQIVFDSAAKALEAFKLCLAAMAPTGGHPDARTVGDTVTVTLRLRRELFDAIDEQRSRLERQSPKGVEISIESAIRALLHEAVEARASARR